jgi:hypothetical protein
MPDGVQILDISGNMERRDRVLYLADVDPDGSLEVIAIRQLIDFIGELSGSEISGKNIRQITLLGLPLFWYTPLAQKHAGYHWGKDVWMLLTLMQRKPELFADSNILLLPEDYGYTAGLLKNIFASVGIRLDKIETLGRSINGSSGIRMLFSWVRDLFRALHWRTKLKSLKASVNCSRNIFVTKLPWSPYQKREDDHDLGEIYNFSRVRSGSTYIPFFTGYDSGEFDWGRTDDRFIRSFPSVGQLVSILCQQIKVWWKLQWSSGEVNVSGHPGVPFKLIRKELLQACNALNFLNYLWLKNYFRQCDGEKRIFYSDEFYTTGRIITSAVRSSGNKDLIAYGVQHALFLKNHTVYAISDKELTSRVNTDDKLPIPHYFIVWGDYFKRLFLSFNSAASSFVISAGNLKYINSQQLLTQNTSTGKEIRLLWCTTLPAYFKAEYNIAGPVLKRLRNYKLTFRLHPLGHIRKESIEEWVDPDILFNASFSSDPNIFTDIARHDLIISTIFSTSFFDALIMGKKACRIVTDISVVDDFSNLKIKNLFDTRSPDEFSGVLENIQDTTKEDELIKIETFCHLKDNIWNRILSDSQ